MASRRPAPCTAAPCLPCRPCCCQPWPHASPARAAGPPSPCSPPPASRTPSATWARLWQGRRAPGAAHLVRQLLHPGAADRAGGARPGVRLRGRAMGRLAASPRPARPRHPAGRADQQPGAGRAPRRPAPGGGRRGPRPGRPARPRRPARRGGPGARAGRHLRPAGAHPARPVGRRRTPPGPRRGRARRAAAGGARRGPRRHRLCDGRGGEPRSGGGRRLPRRVRTTPISYPFALVQGGDTAEARAFLRFLSSPPAQAVFTRRGFGLADAAPG